MISARFHPEARADFKTAAARYATERPDLGQAFYRHTDELVAEIERAHATAHLPSAAGPAALPATVSLCRRLRRQTRSRLGARGDAL